MNKDDETLRAMTLDGWANKVWELSTVQEQEKGLSETWLLMTQFTSNIAEGVRKNEYWETSQALADGFRALCMFVNQCTKYNADAHFLLEPSSASKHLKEKPPFAGIVCIKFPGVCGQCCGTPCTCGLKRRLLDIAPPDKPFSSEELETHRRLNATGISKYNIGEWSAMFNAIFSEGIYQLSLQDIVFHLMEEVGEVSSHLLELIGLNQTEKGLNKERNEIELIKVNLMAEIADVFSWMNSVSIKLGLMSTAFKKTDYKERVAIAENYLLSSLIRKYVT